MRWVAPSEKDTANQTLEKRLWAAADQFRANSGLNAGQYSISVLRCTGILSLPTFLSCAWDFSLRTIKYRPDPFLAFLHRGEPMFQVERPDWRTKYELRCTPVEKSPVVTG